MLLGSTIDKGRKITELYNYLKAGREFLPNGISPLSKAILAECFRYDPRKRINIIGLEMMLDKALGPAQKPGVLQSKAQLGPQQGPPPHPMHQQLSQGQVPLEPQLPIIQAPQQLNPSILAPTIPLMPQELHRQHSRAPQINTSSLMPSGYTNQQRGMMTSLGSPPTSNPFIPVVMQIESLSKSPVAANISRANRNSIPIALHTPALKGSMVDEDSWLARDIRQKETLRETQSSIKGVLGVPLIQSAQQLPVSAQLTSQLQAPSNIQNMQIAPLRTSEMPRPFAPSNRVPELLPMKIPPPMLPNNRGIATTRFMKAPPPMFHR